MKFSLHGHSHDFVQREAKYFKEGWEFEIDGTGTKKGAENENRIAQRFNILKCLKFLKVILIVSQPFIVKNLDGKYI